MLHYLHATPEGRVLQGPQSSIARFERFKANLPTMGEALGRAHDEVDPYNDYRVYLTLLSDFLEIEQRVVMARR